MFQFLKPRDNSTAVKSVWTHKIKGNFEKQVVTILENKELNS